MKMVISAAVKIPAFAVQNAKFSRNCFLSNVNSMAILKAAASQIWQWLAAQILVNYLKHLQACKRGFNKNLINLKH